MHEILIQIASEEAAMLVVSLAVSILSILGGAALNKARQVLGAERVAQLRAALDPAVTRAIARAKAQGLDGDRLVAVAAGYLEETMADTLRGLGTDGHGIRERLRAEIATGGRG